MPDFPRGTHWLSSHSYLPRSPQIQVVPGLHRARGEKQKSPELIKEINQDSSMDQEEANPTKYLK